MIAQPDLEWLAIRSLIRATVNCRLELQQITDLIAERYAREQIADATSGTEFINWDHRSGQGCAPV